jgi:hypothetical protein
MIIYNVTVKVENSISASWLTWLKDEHIPDIIGTGCFSHATVARLIETDDAEGPTYAVQYYAESKARYNRYISNFADGMRKKAFDKWGNQFIAFRSVMEVVH